MKKNISRRTKQQWIDYGKKLNKIFVFYDNKVLDMSDFMRYHSGGLPAIKNEAFKDIKTIFQSVSSHRNVSISKLLRFQCGIIWQKELSPKKKKKEEIIELTKKNTEKENKKKKVLWQDNMDKDENEQLNEKISFNIIEISDQQQFQQEKEEILVPSFEIKYKHCPDLDSNQLQNHQRSNDL